MSRRKWCHMTTLNIHNKFQSLSWKAQTDNTSQSCDTVRWAYIHDVSLQYTVCLSKSKTLRAQYILECHMLEINCPDDWMNRDTNRLQNSSMQTTQNTRWPVRGTCVSSRSSGSVCVWCSGWSAREGCSRTTGHTHMLHGHQYNYANFLV